MKKAVLLYGLSGGLLIAALRLVEYRFLVVEHSIEIYGGLIALLFAIVGIRLGQTLASERIVLVPDTTTASAGPFVRNQAKVDELGITARELEILEHIADGMSTREIAAALRQRKHGEDARQPSVRQAGRQAADPGRAGRQTPWPDSVDVIRNRDSGPRSSKSPESMTTNAEWIATLRSQEA